MRDALQIVVAATLVLLLGMLGFRWLGADTDPVPLVFQQVQGEVTTLRGATPVPAKVGDPLESSDRVSTGAGGRAVLGLGAGTRLELGESASLRVLGQGEDGLRLELEGGKIEARVRPDAGRVQIGAGGRLVSATDADFAMGLADGDLAVETTRGSTTLQGFDGQSELVAGQQVLVSSSGELITGPIPDSLLLSVEWPPEALTRADKLTVRGQTQPGTRVQVDGGARAVADASGNFALELELREGENSVVVQATDPMGRASRSTWTVRRDSTGPTGEFEIPF